MTSRIKPKKKVTPETLLKRDVKQYLSVKGWFHFHIRQGLGSYPGTPDRIAIKNSTVLFIELKSPKGKLSDGQKAFQQDVELQAGRYIVVRSIDDLINYGV